MLNLFIFLYYGCCLGYAVFALLKRRENGLIKAMMIMFLPVLGIILAAYVFRQEAALPVYAEESVSQRDGDTLDLFKPIKTVNVEEEVNFVPLHDALLLNDNKTKRKLLIHSLKENAVQNPDILRRALENDDTETSHYAATSIMEMKRKLQNTIQQLSAELKENPNNEAILSLYATAVNNYLESGFLDDSNRQRYQSLLSITLEKLLEKNKSEKQWFMDKINCDLQLGHHDKALFYSDMFLAEHPFHEDAYLMSMKVKYTLRDRPGLQSVVAQLKKQPVHLSAKSLDIIRFWSKEDNIG